MFSLENLINIPSSIKRTGIARRWESRRYATRNNITLSILCLTRRPSVTSTAGLQMSRDCEQRCPELDACINASLWCDGVSHCPSGYDEALTHCSVLLQLPPLQLALGVLFVITVLGVICFIVWRACRRRGRRSISQHRLKSISSETAIIDGKEVICWHSDSSVRYVEVDRVTTVWRSPSSTSSSSVWVPTVLYRSVVRLCSALLSWRNRRAGRHRRIRGTASA